MPMGLVILIVVCVLAVVVCFSLAAAAKNAEVLSQLWLEKQSKKQAAPCTDKSKKEQEI
jgi:hypothetical protein